jgi:hypothetical protein
MPEYTKLAIGRSATFRVRQINEVTTGKWPEYHLLAHDGRIFTAPKAAIDRQLDYLKLTPATLVGEAVTLSRAPNLEDATKSWWNLTVATIAETQPKPAPKRVPPPPTERTVGQRTFDEAVPDEAVPDEDDDKDDAPPAEDYPVREPGEEPAQSEPEQSEPEPTSKIARARARRDSYLRLWDEVAIHHLRWVNKGIVLTDDGINATAATIWIDLQKANLL